MNKMNRPKFKIGDCIARELEIENANPFTNADIFQILEIRGSCREGQKWVYEYMVRPLRNATTVMSFFESEIVSDNEYRLREKMLNNLANETLTAQVKNPYPVDEVFTRTSTGTSYKLESISNDKTTTSW